MRGASRCSALREEILSAPGGCREVLLEMWNEVCAIVARQGIGARAEQADALSMSRIFSLAVRLGLAEFNPCSRVSKFRLQNQRHRYLLPDEEPALLAQCVDSRKHLANMIPFAIGTGARKSEQLGLKVRQVDFFRNLIVFDKTKSGKRK